MKIDSNVFRLTTKIFANTELLKENIPLVLKSSTNIISCIKCLGDLLITLVAVRSSVERCSL